MAGRLGYGTVIENGTRIPVQTQAAYAPLGYGPIMAQVPSSQPNVPPGLSYSGGAAAPMYGKAGPTSAGATSGSYADSTSYGTAENNDLATAIAGSDPFSFRDSPVLPAILMLLVGLIGLRVIHWRRA